MLVDLIVTIFNYFGFLWILQMFADHLPINLNTLLNNRNNNRRPRRRRRRRRQQHQHQQQRRADDTQSDSDDEEVIILGRRIPGFGRIGKRRWALVLVLAVLYLWWRGAFSFSSTPMDNGDVLLERVKNKLIITLNRTHLSLPMIDKIHGALQQPSELVLIKSQGPKAFCVGGDFLAISKSYKSGDRQNRVYEQFFKREYELNHLIGTIPQPYVALIDGITMGAGLGLSINGPFRVATERTMLTVPETAMGLFPDVGGTHFLSRLPGQLGMFLALTGYRLHGSDVYHTGLATHYIDSRDLLRLSTELIWLPSKLCTRRGVAQLLQRFQPKKIPPFSLDPHLDMIEECFGGHSVEEIMRRLEKKWKKEGSVFAREQLEAMRKMSPTSLKVTFRQIRMGKQLEFSEVFPIEFRLTQRFVADHDFHEGCRAVLIDKDRNPKWKPATLEEVSDSSVDAYFAPFEDPAKELKMSKM